MVRKASEPGPDAAAPTAAEEVEVEMSEPTMYPTLRCYLTWTESSAGSLFAHWSETPVEGAVAKYKPRKAVPKFKITSNSGRAELARDIKKNPSRFYATICGFIKTATALFGESLPQVRACRRGKGM